ncbi:ZIP family metal transporter [Aureitalea marina]|uniref:ZIP family metal transporter n=1 Tax=Aureitalea marina TaxID=930804 RepID=A0A2S7KNV7_9FLAO|nr:ZIP family metal transporter [Aureitalea marina]PQB04268.1 ZIP family metal transporter [Aureitalea marina]
MIYLALILSVLGGAILAKLIRDRDPFVLSITLAFSGAFLLGVTLFELLPDTYESLGKETGLWVACGLLLQLVLDFFTRGAEHGHVHLEQKRRTFPWALFLGLSVHALIEGFPAAHSDRMLVGVIVHKVPVSVILTLVFLRSKYPLKQILVFLTFFAMMSPLGSFVAIERSEVLPYLDRINALSSGVFLHVATTILFESSRDHKFNLKKLIAIIAGFVLAYGPQLL